VRKLARLFFFCLSGLLPFAAHAQQPIRVNCGGPSYTDSKGQQWQQDTGFLGGVEELTSDAITGTADPALFQDFRWNPGGYVFKVPNGSYTVNLYFAEANPAAEVVGGRVFDVALEGKVVFPSLDVFAAVGADAALIKSAQVTVSSGELDISLTRVSGSDLFGSFPTIAAIEILPIATKPVTPPNSTPSLLLNFTYPDGTPVTGALNYSISSSLLSFKGSEPLVKGHAQCVLFANPSALGISAQFTVNLSLTDSAAHQLWQVSLNLNPSNVNFGAIQSSTLNVVIQKQ
jgi:hypothetical protein